jgi:thiol-disulfide isomerase/thioredoxin
MFTGIAAATALIMAQLLIRPRLYRIEPPRQAIEEHVEIKSEPQAQPPPVSPGSVIAESSPPISPPRPPRQVALLGGRLHFKSDVFPMIGLMDAPYLIAAVLDYTCEHCRELHPMLHQAMETFDGQLAVLAIHAPLERACNPAVEFFHPLHVNACAYSRLAMAVWHCEPAKFVSYHNWLFTGPRPLALETARQKAIELVGETPLAQALDSPRLQRHLADGLTVYRVTQAGPLPKLLLPGGLFIGQITSADKLLAVLREQLQSGPTASAPSAATTASAPPRSPFSQDRIS